MRLIILPVAALALIGATEVDDKGVPVPDTIETGALPLDNPGYVRTAAQAKLIERAQRDALPSDEQCRDRITRARKEAGKADLPDNQPASPDMPNPFNPVDMQIGKCAVVVIEGDANDLRPLPSPAEVPSGTTPAADADE